MGYDYISLNVSSNRDTTIDFFLSPSVLDLEEVIVNGRLAINRRLEMSMVEIPMKQVSSLPALGGETDILKALQLMPGIKSGNEAGSGIFVRGGGSDQNLIILDDVPLFYVNHLRDYVSVFNASALQSVQAYKGGFPARFGGRLSSVIDVRMREGDMRKSHGEATLGLVTSKFLYEGPIRKDTSSYLFSIRRFMYDLIMQPLTYALIGEAWVGYTFWDVNGKFNRIINPKNRIYASFYSGEDVLRYKYQNELLNADEEAWNRYRWGNIMGVFRWNHLIGPRMFSNTTVNYSRFRYKTTMGYNEDEDSASTSYTTIFKSSVHEFSMKYDLEYKALPFMNFRSGFKQAYNYFIPESEKIQLTGEEESYNLQDLTMFESSYYIENEMKGGNIIGINAGLRVGNYFADDTSFFTIQPRLLCNLLVSTNMSIKFSYSRMNQNIHQLAYSGMGLSSDLWLPITKKLKPEKSDQYVFGITRNIGKKGIELSLEAYYKSMNNLIDYKEGYNTIRGSNNWQDHIETGGHGRSYGIEFLLQKISGRSTGWISYTLSRTTRQFENINEGKEYPFTYDRTHDVSVVYNFKINEHFDFSASWVFATGNAITLPVAYYYGIDENYNYHWWDDNPGDPDAFTYDTYIEIYEGKNSFRMRSYHKMDLAISWQRTKKKSERKWSLNIYNAYNRKNPFYYYVRDINMNTGLEPEWAIYQKSYFMIMPSVSWTIKF